MVDIADRRPANDEAPDIATARRAVPRWLVTAASIVFLLAFWEYFGRDVNPIFGSYPSAIFAAFVELVRNGKLGAALLQSVQPFLVGYGVAIVIGIPLGLVLGRFWIAEAALGILVTGGYAMPLVALVPLLELWFGLGFTVKVAVIFLMSIFPICINTWLGVNVGAEDADRRRQVIRGLGRRHPAPHRPAGDAALHHGGDQARGRPRRSGMVIAEFFTSISGLGAIIINSANNFDTATMFVPIIDVDGAGGRIELPHRPVRAQRRAVAGRNRR